MAFKGYYSRQKTLDAGLNKELSVLEQKFRSGKIKLTEFTRQTDTAQNKYFKESKKIQRLLD